MAFRSVDFPASAAATDRGRGFENLVYTAPPGGQRYIGRDPIESLLFGRKETAVVCSTEENFEFEVGY